MDRTNAERQRRYIARLKAGAKAHDKDAATNAELREEIESVLLWDSIEAQKRIIDALKRENAALKLQQPKQQQSKAVPRQWSESEQVTELQRQLKAARTRIHSLTQVKNALAHDLDTARRTNPVTITKAEHRKLLKVFHPDTGTHATKKQLDEATQIFTAIKFKFSD